MKKFNYLLSLIIFGCLLSFISCKENANNTKEETQETTAESGIEYDSKYICPMHCKGSGSETEGQCPVCGMDYVMNESYKEADTSNESEEHDHDHAHDHGHDHDHEH